jgi:hypothetical protein
MTDERTHEYGQPIGDPRFYPMGPFFIRQPNNTVFNVASRKINNDVSLLCIATGNKTLKYKTGYLFVSSCMALSAMGMAPIKNKTYFHTLVMISQRDEYEGMACY